MADVSLGKKLAYSSGNLSVNLIAQAFATYIVFYYVDVLGVRPYLISMAMIIHGIVNAVLNPLFGYLSDRTKSRWGRRFPYMMFGMIPLAALFTAIWFPIGTGMALFWYFLIIILAYDILFVMVVLNYSALFPELFVTIKERANVSSWRQMLGIIGMIIGVALPPIVYGSSLGWGMMGVIFAGIALIFFVIALTGSKEKGTAPAATIRFKDAIKITFSNKAFLFYVTGSFFVQFTFAMLPATIPFFTKYVLGASDESSTILLGAIFLVAIPFVYIWGRLVQRWGPRNTILLAVLCYMIAMIPFLFVTTVAAAAVTAGLVGIGLAGLMVLLEIVLSEVIDEDEKRTHERREGMYFGMNGFIVRWGVSLQALVAGIILETTDYIADASQQTTAAIFGIRAMLSIIPILALLCALYLFYLYPIRRNRQVTTDGKSINT